MGKRLKTITTYVNNGNIKKLWSEIKRIKNNGPKQITELTTPNNTTACNTTQLIATQTEYILNSFNNKDDINHGDDILKYIDRKQSDKLTNEQIDSIWKTRANSKLVNFLNHEQNTENLINGPFTQNEIEIAIRNQKTKKQSGTTWSPVKYLKLISNGGQLR